MPRVAVITPTYNRGYNGLLEKTILSVLGQTYPNFVHVIVDDGSTDNTPLVANRYAAHDQRVAYYRRERKYQQKFGASAATNFGIGKLNEFPGVEFLTFLHSDDLYARTNLEKKVEAMKGASIRMVYSWVGVFQKTGPLRISKGPDIKNPAVLARRLKDSTATDFPNHGIFLTAQLLKEVGGFDENIAYGEDRDFSIRVLDCLEEHEIVALPEILHYYRVHEETVSVFCRKNNTVRDELAYVSRKHSKRRDTTFETAKRFIARPHSFLPEPIKRPLRSIRNNIKSRGHEFDIDPFVAQIEMQSLS